MDPNLFRIDWDALGQVLTTIVVLAFFVERALSLLVENRTFLQRFPASGAKELLALVTSVAVVVVYQFDALGVIFHETKPSWIGLFITGAVISGGSKASLKLFHDVLGVKSSAVREQETQQQAAAPAAPSNAAVPGPASPAPRI